MSRVYKITVAESVTRIVHVEDGVQAPLELLPILAPERMTELLAAELIALGFIRDGDTVVRVEADGTTVAVDLTAATVTIRLAGAAEVSEELVRSRNANLPDDQATKARLQGELQAELEARVEERTEALRREVTATLEGKLADLRVELDAAVGRTTIKALTERAGQLGEIESLVSDEAGNVTIKVKL